MYLSFPGRPGKHIFVLSVRAAYGGQLVGQHKAIVGINQRCQLQVSGQVLNSVLCTFAFSLIYHALTASNQRDWKLEANATTD
ncbi:hypothetical protein VTK26DRAFT_3303 [Humicola hyalothermophila]